MASGATNVACDSSVRWNSCIPPTDAGEIAVIGVGLVACFLLLYAAWRWKLWMDAR